MSKRILIGGIIWLIALAGGGYFVYQHWIDDGANVATTTSSQNQNPQNRSAQSQLGQAQSAQQAYPGWLSLPVGCVIGRDCWPLQHFDHDPSPQFLDYACGQRAYEGHDGIDFGLATAADIAKGTPVLAAAPGKVLRTRDGEPDGVLVARGLAAVPKDRMCGNGVLIDHGGGWQTQYCHMARGSILVQQGMTIQVGTHIGAIGMSGAAEFPHLHFEVRHNGRSYDPFAPGGARMGVCGARQSLWTAEALATLKYSPLDLVAIGVAASEPTYKAVVAGRLSSSEASRRTKVLYAWALAWNTKAGDIFTLKLFSPKGKAVIQYSERLKQGHRRHFKYVGQRLRQALPAGTYSLDVTFERAGQAGAVRQRRQTVIIR